MVAIILKTCSRKPAVTSDAELEEVIDCMIEHILSWALHQDGTI